MAWSPETKLAVAPRFFRLATGGSDNSLRIFSSDLSGQSDTLTVLKGHRDYINSVAFHPHEEGGQLVSGSDDHTVCLWDAQTGQRLNVITFDHPVMSVIWHPEEVSKLCVSFIKVYYLCYLRDFRNHCKLSSLGILVFFGLCRKYVHLS